MSGARVIRLVFLSFITLALLVVVGWFVFGPKSSAQLLQEGESYYEAGVAALQEKNGGSARLRFQEAQLRAKDALQRVEHEKRSSKRAGPEQNQIWTMIAGKAFFLQAVALRDEVFAKALAEGKEIPETLDTSTKAKFRTFLVIADPKVRDESITALRQAAMQLPKEKEVQLEAIRYEVSRPDLAWSLARRFAQDMLKLDPHDTRSLYLLARYDFEQPVILAGHVGGPPRPTEKRERARVKESLLYVNKLKEVKDYPLGRTLFLEAQVRQWLANDSQIRGDEANAKKERDALESLLFDEKTGALARCKNNADMKNLSSWDAEGIVGLHLLALDVAGAQQRTKGDALAKVKTTLADTAAVAKQIDEQSMVDVGLEKLNGSLVRALGKTQSILTNENQWQELLESVRTSLKKSLEAERATSASVAELCGILQREALIAGKAGDSVRAARLRVEAREWVDDALPRFAKQKPPVPALELHILAAEMGYASEGKRDAIEPHLKALRESKNPQVQGIVHLLLGGMYEREGRLEKAKQELEQVLTLNNAGLLRSANMALTNIYLALGQPDKALESLQAVEKIYEAFDELTPQEKDWAKNFLRSPDDLAVLLVVANLETAKQRIVKYTRTQPGKAAPPSLFAIHEKLAFGALAKLPKQKKHALLAQQAFINYFALTGRLDRAEKELAAANADHPGSVALLQLDAQLAVRKALVTKGTKSEKEVETELRGTIDERIKKFIDQFPEDRGARLYWVSWLARTGRADEALTYLQSASNFPGVKDTTYRRLLASILFNKGDAKEASKTLQQMPHDPLVDALLIQFADAGAAKTKSVQEAMSRYVSNGLFRIWNAEIASQEKRYADAAKQYFNTLDFTQVKAVALAGLARSLAALAGDKPDDARKLVADMLKDYPNEPVLLLSYAVACLNLDDVGTLEDHWESTKTMASALHAWETAMLKNNPDRAATTLVKAELWTRSNYPDTARVEVLRALENNPNDPTALELILRLDVILVRVAEARKYMAQLKKIKPDAASTALLEAQIDNADNRRADAIKRLEATLEKHPKESAAYNLLVGLLTRDKQSAQAMKWSQIWIAKLPDDLDGAQNLVTQLSLAKNVADAKQKTADFMERNLQTIRKQLDERKYADEKEPEKKRKELRHEARLLLELRFAQAFVRGQNHAEGERRLKAILADSPPAAVAAAAHLTLGEIQLGRQAWKETVENYAKVLDFEKTNFIAGNNLAWVLATKMNQPQKALDVLRTISKGKYSGKTLPGDRLHPEVLDTLGVVYLKLDRPENYQEMSQIFDAACKRYPRDPRMHLYQGYAFAGLAETKKAAESYQSAIELAAEKTSSLSQSQRADVIRDAEAARKKLEKK